MKITVVATLKGGVGKTMMAFNLAGALAEKKKVLLIDVDPQCNLTNNTGVAVTDDNYFSCIDIFESSVQPPEQLIIKSPIPELPNLDIIPSHIYLVATEIKISSKAARERILINYIEDHQKFFKQYDHIIIDTNPSMNIVNQNAFLAADSIILVTDVDDNSRLGLHAFMYLWGEIRKDLRKKDNIKALIINKADVRTNLTSSMLNYCRTDEELSSILVEQMVRPAANYTYAAAARVPITKFKGGEKSAEEIYNVVDILTERGVF